MIILGFVAAGAASVGFNVGIVLQALDARAAPADGQLRLSLLTRLVRHRRWMMGSLLILIGFGMQVLALAWAPFVVVQPMLAAGLLLVLFLGVRMLGERVGLAAIMGVMGISGGIALLAFGSPTSAETLRSEPAVITVTAVLTVVALIPFALRGRGRLDSPTFVIVAAGLAFGAGNVATKMISDSLGGGQWPATLAWLAAAGATAVIALITEMTALQRSPATLVVPLVFGVQTFLPVLLEPLYLRERWATVTLGGAPLIAGLALVALGSVAVARTRAVSALVST